MYVNFEENKQNYSYHQSVTDRKFLYFPIQIWKCMIVFWPWRNSKVCRLVQNDRGSSEMLKLAASNSLIGKCESLSRKEFNKIPAAPWLLFHLSGTHCAREEIFSQLWQLQKVVCASLSVKTWELDRETFWEVLEYENERAMLQKEKKKKR